MLFPELNWTVIPCSVVSFVSGRVYRVFYISVIPCSLFQAKGLHPEAMELNQPSSGFDAYWLAPPLYFAIAGGGGTEELRTRMVKAILSSDLALKAPFPLTQQPAFWIMTGGKSVMDHCLSMGKYGHIRPLMEKYNRGKYFCVSEGQFFPQKYLFVTIRYFLSSKANPTF